MRHPLRTSFLRLLWICALSCVDFAVGQETAPVDLRVPDAFPRFAPVEPKNAESTFVCQLGFRMELIAAEPLVTDPVAMAYDEDGRAYIAEMNDYPYTDRKTHQAWKENTTDASTGKIRLLVDENGDGIFDRSTIFADGLSWPSGVLCWNGGIYVTATPDIWYLKDHDGDGVADERRKVFTGFRKYNVQAVMNNPQWGLDNKIYVAGSSNGGTVRLAPSEKEGEPIALRGDFRFDPRLEKIERVSGSGRYGNTFDDWGHRFLCNIRNPAIQVVLDYDALQRNRFLPVAAAMIDVAEAGDQLPVYRLSPLEPWRDLRARQWILDPTRKVPRSELVGGGVFTSTSGITVYRGHRYPSDMKGQSLLGEVANNVIYRQSLLSNGVVMKAERIDLNVEFVASTDTWFRPVNLINAPDGTLHVLDMYREFIEHPWSIPDDIHEKLDLRSGSDRGRIYRLASPGFTPSQAPKLSRASSIECVSYLDHPSSWWRETAQRLLVTRQEQGVDRVLRERWDQLTPHGKLHSLYTLDGLGRLEQRDLEKAFSDPSSYVQMHGLRLAIDQFRNQNLSLNDQILSLVLNCASSKHPEVAMESAIFLGEVDDPRATAALIDMAVRYPEDIWIRTVILSAPPAQCHRMMQFLLEKEKPLLTPKAAPFLTLLLSVLGAEGKVESLDLYLSLWRKKSGVHPLLNEAFWDGLASGVSKSRSTLSRLFVSASPETRDAIQQRLEEARKQAVDESLDQERRILAIRLMLHDQPAMARESLLPLLSPSQPSSIQMATILTLSSNPDPIVAEDLLDRWRTMTPSVREAALTAMTSRIDRMKILLQAIGEKRVPSSHLDMARRSTLLSHPDASIKSLAQTALGQTIESSRASVIDRYRPSLLEGGDLQLGEAIYMKHCASCHRLRGKGNDLGPNLETVRQWDREKLLTNILDPNREVAPQYVNYTFALEGGEILAGLISEETPASITLLRKDAKPEVLLRKGIQQMATTGQSFMPIGLEETISVEEMRGLIAYLLK